jgi:hypothetical protein
LNALEGVEFSWRQEFLHEWGKLEDEKAFAVSEGLKVFDAAATQRIHAAAGRLKRLVELR